MSDSVRPHRRKPTRLLCPWDSPGKNAAVGCHFLLQCMKVKSESEVTQSCPTLSDPMDCSLQGSSIHGISQARVLEWGAIAFSGHRTRKHQSSFQFPRRAVLKHVQTTGQLHSSPMLVRFRSKFVKLGFSIMWTENFQMFKLLDKTEELEIKLQTFAESWESKGIPDKYLPTFH